MNKKVGKKIIGIGVGTLTFFLSLGCAYFLTPNRVKKGNFVSIEKDEYEESHFMKFINTFAKDTGISESEENEREREYYGMHAEFENFALNFDNNTIAFDGDLDFLMRGMKDINFNLDLDVDWNTRNIPLQVGYINHTFYLGLKDLRMKVSSVTMDEVIGDPENNEYGLLYNLFVASEEEGGINFDIESWLDENPNLKIQIELIGAAATLVAERFKNENIDISRESAILLYYGIISNTMNLKIKLTSQKDIEMANWLKSKVPEITDETTTEIFVKKSQIGESLREEMEVEFKDQFMTISWSMGQLEVANVDDFLNKYEDDIRKILDTVSKENDVDYISVNCMDIINGYSIIVARDDKTAKVISDAVGFEFKDLKAKTNELVSRKEIVKVIRGIYKK